MVLDNPDKTENLKKMYMALKMFGFKCLLSFFKLSDEKTSDLAIGFYDCICIIDLEIGDIVSINCPSKHHQSYKEKNRKPLKSVS